MKRWGCGAIARCVWGCHCFTTFWKMYHAKPLERFATKSFFLGQKMDLQKNDQSAGSGTNFCGGHFVAGNPGILQGQDDGIALKQGK